ncbi:CBS domain-containing protein [Alteromonas gilva]|uniref:CBS domain-containing protein n=1 Tax=Alteromonas gilva TaxID=2987522 RepID=A0ABT5KXT7_9ALTE|nr:CBS domain-containing protein [Alteromonas gilva]MDC8829580.1 CBS domain-containing protein [Alteromonas gilva]
MHHLSLCKTEAFDTLAQPSLVEHLELKSSALSVFTDFQQYQPQIIDSNAKAIELEHLMRVAHVKMKLVVDQSEKFVGIVTLTDIDEQKILQRVAQLQISRSELLVADMMQPKATLHAFNYHDLKAASVADVIDTLKENGAMHCLVIDQQHHAIRGVISVSDIVRRLRIPLDIQSLPSFAALSNIIAA